MGVTFIKELIAPIVKQKCLIFQKSLKKNRQKLYFPIGAFFSKFFFCYRCNFPVTSYVCKSNVYLLLFLSMANSKGIGIVQY